MNRQVVTHIARVRAQNAYNRMQVSYLTKMSDAMLSQFQFDTGLQWLTMYTASPDDVVRWLLSQPMIWKWWLNEWNRRDEDNLPILYKQYEAWPDEVSFMYRSLHQACFIERQLPWTLLENGYAKVIGEFNKTITA